jgi:cytochrome c-type biogenesis protein CcmH
MINLFLPLLCAAVLLAALMILARPLRVPLALPAAFLMLGLAGYAWQGSPGLAGAPVEGRPPARLGQPTLFAQERGAFFEKMGLEAQVLDTADALIRNGNAAYAAGVLRGALSRQPDSATLWIGYGNALTAYAEGQVTPAARFAYDRGAVLAPSNPAARYFLALALAEGGDLDGAETIWRAVVPVAEARPAWRQLVMQKLQATAIIRRMQEGRP